MKRCLAAVAFALSLGITNAYADTPSRAALLHDAEAEAAAGHVVAAMRTTAKVVDEMPLASASREEKEAFQRGLDLMARLRSEVAHLTIAVAGVTPSIVQIEVDGARVTSANDVLVDPGEHVIVAKAMGHDTAVATVRVRAGESKGVPLTLREQMVSITTRETSSPIVLAPANVAPVRKESSGATTGNDDLLRPFAYATLATGAGALVLGIGTTVLAQDRVDEIKEACPDGRCPRDATDQIERARTYSQIATGAFVVSGIALATSAVLFLVAPKKAPAVTATANGIGGRF